VVRKQTRFEQAALWLILAMVGLSAGSCRQDPTGRDGTLRASEFVDIIVAIRTAELEAQAGELGDDVEEAFARRKAEILDRHNATEADLHEFMEHHYAQPGLMSAVWDSIAHRLRTPATLEEGRPDIVDDDW
jgi:hypothetical protein